MFDFVVSFWDTIYQFCDKVWSYLTMPTYKALAHLCDEIPIIRWFARIPISFGGWITPDSWQEKYNIPSNMDEYLAMLDLSENHPFFGNQPLWVTCIFTIAFISIAYNILRWIFDMFEG